MTQLNLRFIEAKFCPMATKGGWAVPAHGRYRPVITGDVVVALHHIGLAVGDDYTIQLYSDSNTIKRVKFQSEEAFTLAKLLLA